MKTTPPNYTTLENLIDENEINEVFKLLRLHAKIFGEYQDLAEEYIHDKLEGRQSIQYKKRLKTFIHTKLHPTKAKHKSTWLSPQPKRLPKQVIGRDMDLLKIHEKLQADKPILLMNGIGGVGKTSLAAYYVKQYESQYDYLVWLDFQGDWATDLVRSIHAKEVQLDLTQMRDLKASAKVVTKTLEELDGPKLLVVDNLDDVDILGTIEQHLPNNWTVLLTSRCYIADIMCYEVGVLTKKEAKKLFQIHHGKWTTSIQKEGHKETDLEALLDFVGCHTLVVELLAKTLRNSPSRSIADVLIILKEEGLKAMPAKQIRAKHNKDEQLTINTYVASIFAMDFDKMTDTDKHLMKQFSVLPSVLLSFEELTAFKVLEKVDVLEDAVMNLLKQGWLEEPESGAYYMHPIVREVIRGKLEPRYADCVELVEYFIDALYFKAVDNPAERFPLIPYGDSLLTYLNEEQEQIATLTNNLQAIYKVIGNYNKALELQLKTVSILESLPNKNETYLAASYNNLSLIYNILEEYDKALRYQLKAINIQERILNLKHPNLAMSYNNLAIIYEKTRVYDKALIYQFKAINIQEEILGFNDPSLAKSYNNLSMIYNTLGGYTEALKYQLKTIAIEEKVLGFNHPSLAISYNNLSSLYQALGVNTEALKYQLRAIAIEEKVLGLEHPSLGTSYWALGTVYIDLKDFDKAKMYIDKGVEILEKVLPKGHSYMERILDSQDILNAYFNGKDK